MPSVRAYARIGGRWKHVILVALLIVVGAGLRIAPIDHGFPRSYIRDSDAPHAAIRMLRDRDPVPELGRHTHEPYLLSYVMVPAFAAHYAIGRIRGEWSDSFAYGNYLIEHPEAERRIGRWVVALFGILTCWVGLRIARELGLTTGAWVASWIVATSLSLVHLSCQERTWMPMICFTALAVWASLVHQKHGGSTSLLLAAAAASCAFSMRLLPEQGRVVLGIAGLAWFLSPRPWRGVPLGRRFLLALAAVLTFTVLALVAGRPFLLRYADRSIFAVVGEQFAAAIGAFFAQRDFLFTERAIPFTFRWSSLESIGSAFFGYEPVVLALGAIGYFLALRRREYWPLLTFTLLWALLFVAHRNGHMADAAPLALCLAFPAALAFEWSWRWRWARPLLAAALLLPLSLCLRYDWVMRQADTRALAELRLAELPGGSVIAIDGHGPTPELSQGALERLADLRARRHSSLSGRETHRLEQLRGAVPGVGPGLDVLPLPEVLLLEYSGGPLAGLAGAARRRAAFKDSQGGGAGIYRVWDGGVFEDLVWPGREYQVLPRVFDLGREPRDVLRHFAVRYLLLVDFHPALTGPHPLERLTAGREPLWVIDPGPAGQNLREARLPFEPEFPLVSLWQVQRPGPRLRLFELP